MLSEEVVIRAYVVSLVLLAAFASGCDDDGPAAPEPDREAIRTGLAALYAGDHATPDDRRDGACFAGQLVTRATPQQLLDAGVLEADWTVVAELPRLPEELAGHWVDAQFACVDFVEESARAQGQASHGTVDEAAYAACLRDRMPTDRLRDAVIDTLTGDWGSADVARLSEAQQACAAEAA